MLAAGKFHRLEGGCREVGSVLEGNENEERLSVILLRHQPFNYEDNFHRVWNIATTHSSLEEKHNPKETSKHCLRMCLAGGKNIP